jgi:hypothetical protein
MKDRVQRKLSFDVAESQTPSTCENSMRENREVREAPFADGGGGRSGKAEPKPDMHATRKSDGVVVPTKPANNGSQPMCDSAETAEGRTPTKGNAERTHPVPDAVPDKWRGMKLLGIRLAARGYFHASD